MKKESKVKTWLRQIRAPFLILPVALVSIGVAYAYREGIRHWGHFLLLLAGVTLAHIAVNLFNELSDFKTGIDEATTATPFSGGSGMLQAGETTYKSVSAAAYGTLLAAAAIGLYFCFTGGWVILIFMVTGGIAVRFYTTHFARWLIGEFISGLTLGTFVVLGVYYALAGRLGTGIILVSIPPGILTFLLLFLNEFPDAEADRKGGRHHLVIHLGKKKSAVLYILGLAAVYITIMLAKFIGELPHTLLLALLTLPLAVKAAAITLRNFDHTPRLIPALGLNVGIVIFTDLLLAVGLFL